MYKRAHTHTHQLFLAHVGLLVNLYSYMCTHTHSAHFDDMWWSLLPYHFHDHIAGIPTLASLSFRLINNVTPLWTMWSLLDSSQNKYGMPNLLGKHWLISSYIHIHISLVDFHYCMPELIIMRYGREPGFCFPFFIFFSFNS